MKATTSVSPIITRLSEGLTAEGVSYRRVRRPAAIPASKKAVLAALPVSLTECVCFAQQSGYVERDIDELERSTPLRFHAECNGITTHVWRVA